MGKAYTEEMRQLPETMRWADRQSVDLLRRGVQLYRDRGLLAVGSGGSSTAAVFAAELHLRVFGRPSQAITPLEVIQLPAVATSHAAGLLLSAEGKNHDILAAARQLLLRGFPAIGLTLRSDSPLTRFCDSTGAAVLASYDMPWDKDGYLATNSLIATLVMLWRAYIADSEVAEQLPKLLEWHEAFCARLTAETHDFPRDGRTLILHGMAGRVGAIDLESKLAEGALAFGQISNFRQFAHGRHLQLQNPNEQLVVVSFCVVGDPLAEATHRLLPPLVRPPLNVELPAIGFPGQEIAAVLAAFAITQAWAGEEMDPGRPDVPQFGRDLHNVDLASLITDKLPERQATARKQIDVRKSSLSDQHAHDYLTRLKTVRVRALICDFDGTFCDTVRRYGGLDAQLAHELTRLARDGVYLAFATGRGIKLAQELRNKLPHDVWSLITLGCYSGSHIFELSQEDVAAPSRDPRLLELAHWLCDCRALPAQIELNVDGGQLGLRDLSSADKWRLIAAINEWIARKAYSGWRTFSSGHSADVITEYAGKRRVVEHVCERFGLDPHTEVLRLGDAGDFGGNDYELLSEGLGLSVDAVSPDLAQCWNLLPRTLRGARGTQYYLQSLESVAGEIRFSAAFLEQATAVVQESLGHR
ncbi:HAD hydrolase family protein [Burkholderia ubonensis]|uniref:HAD hydrolase family protein n=1 Tax=Burkholderia ubonensis TaxID=101571 RepID=UPI000A8950BA|nr:HAD hydrolase family protein [Burkholderia ubonensis]